MAGTLAIIGAGRVGRALGRRLRELGWKIGAVVTRNEAGARKAVRSIGAGHAHAFLTRQVLLAQVILITTSDRGVAAVAEELARIGAEELRGKVVLHTSGALNSEILAPVKACGASVGSMHPLQSFSGVGVPPLEGRVFAIEGDTAAVRVARHIARSRRDSRAYRGVQESALSCGGRAGRGKRSGPHGSRYAADDGGGNETARSYSRFAPAHAAGARKF